MDQSVTVGYILLLARCLSTQYNQFPVTVFCVTSQFPRMVYSSALNISSSSESEIEMSFEVSQIEDSVNEGMHNIKRFRIEPNASDSEEWRSVMGMNPLGNTNW